MPADVERLSYAKFSNRDVPWWGTGTSAKEMVYEGHFLTDEEAALTFPWRVELRPAYQHKSPPYGPKDNPHIEQGYYDKVKGTRFVTLVHENPYDPDHESVLGVVGKKYASDWQPIDLIEFGSELTDHYGAKWATVGDLKHHQIIFGSLRLEQVKDTVSSTLSPTDWYLLVTNDFTGNGSFRCDIVPISSVCANTHSLALQLARVTWKLRHVGNMRHRAVEARAAIGLVEKYQAEYSAVAKSLAATEFELAEFKALTDTLLPTHGTDTFTGKKIGPRTAQANEENRDALISNFLHSPTVEEEWRKTKWGALSAVTEWSEWIYDRRTDIRTDSTERRMFTTLIGTRPQWHFVQKAFSLLTT